jgi:hypothetical protein
MRAACRTIAAAFQRTVVAARVPSPRFRWHSAGILGSPRALLTTEAPGAATPKVPAGLLRSRHTGSAVAVRGWLQVGASHPFAGPRWWKRRRVYRVACGTFDARVSTGRWGLSMPSLCQACSATFKAFCVGVDGCCCRFPLPSPCRLCGTSGLWYFLSSVTPLAPSS